MEELTRAFGSITEKELEDKFKVFTTANNIQGGLLSPTDSQKALVSLFGLPSEIAKFASEKAFERFDSTGDMKLSFAEIVRGIKNWQVAYVES
mmetsp:Transcript_18064/g.20117  ORF Transcript_18064/g.20117 Transcript_18064/m.20117 type:complete len:93 (-) Transcript_18064:40-318(-)